MGLRWEEGGEGSSARENTAIVHVVHSDHKMGCKIWNSRCRKTLMVRKAHVQLGTDHVLLAAVGETKAHTHSLHGSHHPAVIPCVAEFNGFALKCKRGVRYSRLVSLRSPGVCLSNVSICDTCLYSRVPGPDSRRVGWGVGVWANIN